MTLFPYIRHLQSLRSYGLDDPRSHRRMYLQAFEGHLHEYVKCALLTHWPSDSWVQQQRRRTRIRIWMISICFVFILAIIVALFAWLGAHNWFKDNSNAGGGE